MHASHDCRTSAAMAYTPLTPAIGATSAYATQSSAQTADVSTDVVSAVVHDLKSYWVHAAEEHAALAEGLAIAVH